MYLLCQLCAVEDTLSLFWCVSPSERRHSSLLLFGSRENRTSPPFFLPLLAHGWGVSTARRSCNLSLTWRLTPRCSRYCERPSGFSHCDIPAVMSFTVSIILYVTSWLVYAVHKYCCNADSTIFEKFRLFFSCLGKILCETDTKGDSQHCYDVYCVTEEAQCKTNG